MGRGHRQLHTHLLDLLADAENELPMEVRELLHRAYRNFLSLSQQIADYDKRLLRYTRTSPVAQRLLKIRGVGPVIATYLVCCLGDGQAYKNGRAFSAAMGLVPREYSSGGKHRLMGIGRQGNKYLRRILAQGAQAVLNRPVELTDPLSRWAHRLLLEKKRHRNVVVIAVANKILRISLSMVKHGTAYGFARMATVG